MATLSVTGLPENAKLQKIVFLFKNVLKRENVIEKFWIREMADIRGTGLKYAKLEFNNFDDVVRAAKALDGFLYFSGEAQYLLTAKVDGHKPRRRSPSPVYRARERDRFDERCHYDRYDEFSRDRVRDRSPLIRETSQLDLEIELLRKRRLIIEEERRLLLERKKLELVKEYGPNALKEFKSMDDRHRSYVSPPRGREYRPRRSPPRPIRPRPARPPIRNAPPRIPQFNMPCKVLLLEMKEVISKHCPGKENPLLIRLLRSSLRRRIAILLEGKPILPGAKIVTIYRDKYPASTDEDLVKKHMKEVKACYLRKSAEPEDESSKMEGNEEKSKLNSKPSDAEDDANMKKLSEPEAILPEGAKDEVLPQANEEQDPTGDTRSMGSSEALALHDKSDEDWVKGEHGWEPEENQGNIGLKKIESIN